MNLKQKVFLAMINSYNLVTNKATFQEILDSDINLFAHIPDDALTTDLIYMMIDYFQDIEMYEKCIELKQLLEDTFNEDGTIKSVQCECDYPEFNSYVGEIKCNKCKKTIKK